MSFQSVVTIDEARIGEKEPIVLVEAKEDQIESSSLEPCEEQPPDGGLQAWLQVIMGHLILINTSGYLASFGIFEAYHTDALNVSHSIISWVGSAQIFLVYFVGIFSGRCLDAGYFHTILIAGCSLQVLALITASFSTTYWQLFLSQGIAKGLGDGLIFCPTLSLVATYFKKKRALAMAITASGGATGGIIFPVVAYELLPRVGFSWTIRTMAFMVLFNNVLATMLAKPRLPSRPACAWVEWGAFRELPFCLFCAAMFFSLWAVYIAYFFVSAYSEDIIGTSKPTGFIILLVLNAVGFPARLVWGLMADHFFGATVTLIPVVLGAGILLYFWVAVKTLGGLYGWSVFYGFFAAGIQSLFPSACASLTKDLKKMGTRTGICFTVASFACLTGPPIAGALIENKAGDFLHAQIFSGSVMILSGGFLVAIFLIRKS